MKVCVIGSGVLGKNLVRALAARGDQVTVLSNRPVELPALWRRCDAVSGEGLRRGLQGVEALVFAAAAQHSPIIEDLARQGLRHAVSAAAHAGVERVILVGPTGARAGARAASLRAHHEGTLAARKLCPTMKLLRIPALFGADDHLLEPWLERIRHGRPLMVRHREAELRPLWVGDAVRVLLELVQGTLERPETQLQGPERLRVDELATRVCAKFSAKRALFAWGAEERPEDLARLPEQLDASDDWEALKLGERSTVSEYLDRWSRQHYGGASPLASPGPGR